MYKSKSGEAVPCFQFVNQENKYYEFSLDVHKSEKKQQEKKTKSENIETRDGGK